MDTPPIDPNGDPEGIPDVPPLSDTLVINLDLLFMSSELMDYSEPDTQRDQIASLIAGALLRTFPALDRVVLGQVAAAAFTLMLSPAADDLRDGADQGDDNRSLQALAKIVRFSRASLTAARTLATSP